MADLKKFMDKKLAISLNGGRKIEGVLRGHDQFMNLVLENTEEILYDKATKEEKAADIGTVVIRGNSVIQIESLEAVN